MSHPDDDVRPDATAADTTPDISFQPLEHELDVLRAIRRTAFGTVEVTVHQSRIVQITQSERVRFDAR